MTTSPIMAGPGLLASVASRTSRKAVNLPDFPHTLANYPHPGRRTRKLTAWPTGFLLPNHQPSDKPHNVFLVVSRETERR